MSILKKNLLAVALVAGLSMAGTAGAYSITTGGPPSNAFPGNDNPEKVADAQIANNATVYTLADPIYVAVGDQDAILGRTTGFNVRIDLLNAAIFNANPTVTLGANNTANGWTINQISGGAGSKFVIYAINPPANPGPAQGLQDGELFRLTNTAVRNLVTDLTTGDNTLEGQVRFTDPVGGSDLPFSTDTTPLLQAGNPVAISCDNNGDSTKTIDVGATPGHPSKTYFSSTGTIGANDSNYMNLGEISVSDDPDFATFTYEGTDEFTTVLTGDFSAFTPSSATRHVFLASDAACSVQLGSNGVVNTTNNTVTFEYTGADVGITPDGFDAFVCVAVPANNTVLIDATAVTATTTFTRDDVVVEQDDACDLLPLRYNGSVVDVYHINPAGNTTAQSFVRIINPGNAPGLVTLIAWDDAGNREAAPVSFILGARQSMQLNSEDLESGAAAFGKPLTGAWGNGSGKWRARVTGEFANMLVQGLNRNADDGTVTNLTDADNRGEQFLNGFYNNQ